MAAKKKRRKTPPRRAPPTRASPPGTKTSTRAAPSSPTPPSNIMHGDIVLHAYMSRALSPRRHRLRWWTSLWPRI
eukprot:445330-Pyramimonas_sp.AAC.1